MQELINVLPASVVAEICFALGYAITINGGKITVERKRERWKRN